MSDPFPTDRRRTPRGRDPYGRQNGSTNRREHSDRGMRGRNSGKGSGKNEFTLTDFLQLLGILVVSIVILMLLVKLGMIVVAAVSAMIHSAQVWFSQNIYFLIGAAAMGFFAAVMGNVILIMILHDPVNRSRVYHTLLPFLFLFGAVGFLMACA